MTEIVRQEEFAEQLQEVQYRLTAYIFALLRNWEDTQEVYQQTCVTLWRKFDEFEGRSSFATWACGVARLTVKDYLKRQHRYRARFSQAMEDQLVSAIADIPSDEEEARQAALEGCIEKLSPKDRQLVRDCYGGQHSVAAVAAELGRSTRGLYGTLRKLRERLLRCVNIALNEAF